MVQVKELPRKRSHPRNELVQVQVQVQHQALLLVHLVQPKVQCHIQTLDQGIQVLEGKPYNVEHMENATIGEKLANTGTTVITDGIPHMCRAPKPTPIICIY